MPFKIYTYEDPYKLDKADFWSEISALPHFCSARTLVNGLKDVLGDSIKGLICPLDELVQHEEVYMQWTDNISLRVQQYSAFSSAFKQLLEKRRISKPFHMALEQNQNHFLEAIRLFIELDISASAIDGSKGNTEQKLFVHMLKKAQESSLFRFPQTPSREKLKEIVVSLAKKEVEECTGTPQEVKRCERAVGATKELPFDSIVVHGVHQFTPVQLRLLLAMEKMGITIIFLFNYQKKYSKIYSSWNDIYGCFEVPIHHDTVVREYTPPTMQNPSNALACALGEICEDRNAVGSGMLRKWYKLYKSVQLMEFANITEYAHFVSNHFDAAIQRYSESRSVMERGNDVWSNAAVLRHLDEQVYTANRDVHTLLKIYYPEYAKDRHFLSYPIGQFFSAIYRLWDYENGKIIFDVSAIKECLSSNILSVAPGEVLLRTFYNVEILFENVTTYDEFQREIVEGYAKNYDKLAGTPGNDALSELKNLSIYNKYKVTKKDKRSDAMKYLPKILEQEAQKLEPFFKFWKATEIFDLKARARNYLVHEVITNGSGLFVKPYDSEHMNMRKHFGAALFAVDVSEVERKNPYQEFEALVRRDGWNKIYSLHRLPLPGNQEKADILRNETKLYLNQACRKDKTAIPSDWCIYCVHRENCMESFLRSEVGMSSSRNEPCINRSVRANAPAKTTLPPVCEQEIIDVEAVPAEPIVPATASIIDTAPAVEAPIVETPVVDVPAVEAPASEVVFVESPAAEVPTHVDTPKSPELSIFEQMFRQIQEMVEGNRQEIQSLKGELAARQSRREDTTRIQARLEDEEHRSQELLDKLAETESRLATSEAQVKKQRELEFTESELAELRKYSTIIVFDTCSIMNCPNLLDGVNDGELVVVPKDVNNELEHHKTRFGADDRKFKAQKAITAIFNYKRRFPLAYADGLLSLVPEAYRAKADEKEQNDNKILAVALRYKIYTDIPVIFITDDRSLSNKASGEGLEVWTSKDFLAPPETSFDDESPTVPGTPAPIPELEAQIAEAAAVETPALESSEEERLDAEAAETKRQAKAKEDYLAQKISTKLLHLEASQISLLQNNGIKTIADFMAQTENSFASMKVKKGIPFTARFLKEQETIRCKLENL